MAIPRKKVLEKIAGKRNGIDYHLDEHIPGLIGRADKGLVECWRKEVTHFMAAAQIYDEIPQLFEEQKGVHDWNSFVDDEVAG